jgi:23S rRNA (adenine2503-C2)-methyltransferase
MAPTRPDLYTFTRAELTARITGWDFSPVHAARLWRYLYWECAGSLEAMPDLPAKVRDRLAAEMSLGVLPIAREQRSTDGFTRKFLLSLEDHRVIETVLMRFTGSSRRSEAKTDMSRHGAAPTERVTACVSSQAGCAMGCVFCATGQLGFQRHLSAGEIVAQAVHVNRLLRLASPAPAAGRTRLRNIVLMGMGEPLHNYEAVMKAVDILRDPNGLSLGAERITLSTVGVVPGILRLAAERRPVHLAVSLHAATQPERLALVPVAQKWPLDALMDACRTYSAQTGRRIFYEWTLIEDKNDSPDHARAVGRLLAGLPAQVNLIPLNPTGGYAGAPARSEAARRFQQILAEEFRLPSTVRQRRGLDIAAGCGQLAGQPA